MRVTVLEKTFQKSVKKIFEDAGWWVGINNPDGDPGRPDLILCKGQKYCFLELKTSSQLRPQQIAWMTDTKDRVANVFVLYGYSLRTTKGVPFFTLFHFRLSKWVVSTDYLENIVSYIEEAV